jgi:endogenous inhibitor of DNA gyrase (YacG/DUF329 family)
MTEPVHEAPCPVCGKPADRRLRPFCSRRCADVDLGRWLTGQYRIPGTSPVPESEVEDAAETEGQRR